MEIEKIPKDTLLAFFNEKKVEDNCIKKKNNRLKTTFQTLFLLKGTRQQDLANHLGRDRAYVSRIVNGLDTPPLRIRLKIAEYFDTDSALIWHEDLKGKWK